MVINSNIQAQQTANNLNVSSNNLSKSLSRLSSGSKIIAPSDDAAGLAVSSRLESQLKRLDAAINNVVNAVSFTQTQDGFLKTIDKAFRRMSELAMFAQDSTKSASDLTLYSQEFTQLQEYVSQTVTQTFNSVKLFGSDSLAVTIDAGGTSFDMPPINLGKIEYTTSLSNVSLLSSSKTRLTRDLTAKTLTMAVSKEEFDKLKAGGSMTLSNLTSGKSDAALTAANAAKLAADATKAAADTAVQGNNLAKAYFDAKDISTSKIAAESSAIAAKTAAIDAEALAQAEKLVADAGTDAAKKTAAAAAVTAATAAVTAATAAVTAATTEKTAAATAFTSVAAIANANTAAKELIDDKLAADTDATSKAATLTAAQAAFDADASSDLSILNGTYDIKSTSDANGTYSIVLDLSHSNSALSGSANIEDFQMASNPNSATPVSLKSGLDISSVPRAQAALSRIKSSIDKLAQDRASLGAVQSRLNFTNEQLTVTKENLSAAISRIADVDVAEEATAYARYQILVQSGVSMLAQANKMPQSALQLLQG